MIKKISATLVLTLSLYTAALMLIHKDIAWYMILSDINQSIYMEGNPQRVVEREVEYGITTIDNYGVSSNKNSEMLCRHGAYDEDIYYGMLNLGLMEQKAYIDSIYECEEDNNKLINLIALSGVKVIIDGAQGSGCIISMSEKSMIIATNKHVIDGSSKVTLIINNGHIIEGNVIATSGSDDVAFIEVKYDKEDYTYLHNLGYILINATSYKKNNLGDDIIAIGSDEGINDVNYQGRIIDDWLYVPYLDSYIIYCDCIGRPGMSGGGIFDDEGNYIGMIVGALNDNLVAIPIETITKEYISLVGKIPTYGIFN